MKQKVNNSLSELVPNDLTASELKQVYVTAVKCNSNEVWRIECASQVEAFDFARLYFENGYSVCIKRSL